MAKIPNPEVLRVYGVKINLFNGRKMYAPMIVFGGFTRLLRLSFKTSTMAQDYGNRVLKRYASLLEVERA